MKYIYLVNCYEVFMINERMEYKELKKTYAFTDSAKASEAAAKLVEPLDEHRVLYDIVEINTVLLQ